MNRFEYLEASTLPEAIALLGQHEGARIVAGATDFLVRWRQGVWKPRVGAEHPTHPWPGRGELQPGQRTQPGDSGDYPPDRTASAYPGPLSCPVPGRQTFAGVQIRHLATVGGNICNASPAGDTLPALLAYEAECHLSGPEGERLVPLESFLLGPGQTVLRPAELLTELHLPPLPPRSSALYIKHSPRSSMDISAVGVASVISLEARERRLPGGRIAMGAVGADGPARQVGRSAAARPAP